MPIWFGLFVYPKIGTDIKANKVSSGVWRSKRNLRHTDRVKLVAALALRKYTKYH